MADPEQERREHQATIAGHASEVISLLSEPRAFLLFLFAVLALFEWASYAKTERFTAVLIEVMASLESNRTREMDGQQRIVGDLIDILEYRGNGAPPRVPPVTERVP